MHDSLPEWDELLHRIDAVCATTVPPPPAVLYEGISAARESCVEQAPHVRPRASHGLPGGFVDLPPSDTLVIVPDVHARLPLVRDVLSFPLNEADTVGHAVREGRATIVFVGDYVHCEHLCRDRWLAALDEYRRRYRDHVAMDAEMAASLWTLVALGWLKVLAGPAVQLLKGNHENIANENRDGNVAFYKFAREGEMVAEYMRRFYRGAPFEAVYEFEKQLPLLARSRNVLVSHAEPAIPFTLREVVDGANDERVVFGLTWTDNGAARAGSVATMLRAMFPASDLGELWYFGGHRPVSGRYRVRADGRFVQIHNPNEHQVAVVRHGAFEPNRDIVNVRRQL